MAACGVFEIGLRLGGAIALLGSVAPVVALCRLAASVLSVVAHLCCAKASGCMHEWRFAGFFDCLVLLAWA